VKMDEIIFTSGSSESNNFAIKGVAFKYKNRGKHIITSSIEHKSVLECFKQLEKEFGFEVTYLEPNEEGRITLETLEKNIRKDTILVSIMYVNNEIGTINPIPEIGKFLSDKPTIIFHCDATQAIGKIPVDLNNIDLVSVSAHKIYGLKGSGILVKKKNIELLPLIAGGGQEYGYRSGTSNWPVNVMFAKTLRLAFDSQIDNYNHVLKLKEKIINHLQEIENIQINTPVENASPYIINFSIKNKKAAVIAQAFDDHGICLSTISACSTKTEMPSHVIYETFKDIKRAESSIRVSMSKYTTFEEITKFLMVLDEIMISIKG
ncbi:MAG: cysteine desulfurase family protein, partial [Erysipelotrichales bacterium]|nr:cysteine desulfurase family protein [Erysipelotrichales bacterium]